MAAVKKTAKKPLPITSPKVKGWDRAQDVKSREPKPPIFQVMGPKELRYFMHDNASTLALVWEERELRKEGEGKDAKFHIVGKCWHVLYTGDMGQPNHQVVSKADAHHPNTFKPCTSKNTPEEALEYWRERARRFGAPSAVWRIMGLEAPAHDPKSAPESQAAHDEMYRRAAEKLGIPEAELRKKYGHLNPGLQQMNLRNRLRAKGVTV